MLERDYVLRLIQLFAQAVARILGLKRAGQLDDALEAVSLTADEIFGTLRITLDAIDPQSAARLLASQEKIEVYAILTAEEASIFELKGDAARATNGYRRALSFYLEAELLELTISDEASAAISELRSKVDESTLPQRYRDALASRET
jgi:hypothetical protein